MDEIVQIGEATGELPRRRFGREIMPVRGQIGADRRPVEGNVLAGPFLQRLAIGGDSFLQLFGPALPLPEPPKREAEVVLRRRPVERNALAGNFLQCLAIGGDSFLQLPGPALPLGLMRSVKQA